MKSPVNAVIAGCAGLAIFCLLGCSTTHHVTETTTTREYDAPNTQPLPQPLPSGASENSTTTITHYDNGTVQQRTVTHPTVSAPPGGSTTTVTTDSNNGDVQRRTTTTY
jgi:hypothetical protein